MGTRTRRGNKTFMVAAMVLAGLCLMRVIAVADEVEVYASQEEVAEDSSRSSDEEREYSEIRLTRPEESEARIADDQGHEMVRGAERLWAAEKPKYEIGVPVKTGRKIASEPASDDLVRDGVATTSAEAYAAPQPSHGSLNAGVMEPRRSERSNWVDHGARAARPSYGIKGESPIDTQIDPPLPSSSTRAGVQEISLIVSDYGYFPNRVFVTQNVPVKIYMTTPSKNTLCFMLDNMGLKKGITPGKVEEITFTPGQAGNFRFYCPVKSIEGTLTVREAPLAEQSVRGLASEQKLGDTARADHNEPKNATELRSLIED